MAKFNRLISNVVIITILVLVLSPTAEAGGPWTKEKGKYYIKLSEWWLKFDKHYTDTGELDPNITTGIFNTFLFAEYGITNRMSATFNGAIFSRNYMNNLRSNTTNEVLVEGDAINSVGDLDLQLKYSLTRRGAKFPVAISLGLGIPTGATNKGEFGNLQTGDGEFNQQIQIDAGRGFSFHKSAAYISAYTAINNRTKGYSEEFKYGAEVGLGVLSKKLWLNAKFNGIKSLKNGDTAATITSTSLFANNTEYNSIAFEGNYYITNKIGLSAGFATAVSGKIIAAAPSYNVGIFIDLK